MSVYKSKAMQLKYNLTQSRTKCVYTKRVDLESISLLAMLRRMALGLPRMLSSSFVVEK